VIISAGSFPDGLSRLPRSHGHIWSTGIIYDKILCLTALTIPFNLFKVLGEDEHALGSPLLQDLSSRRVNRDAGNRDSHNRRRPSHFIIGQYGVMQ